MALNYQSRVEKWLKPGRVAKKMQSNDNKESGFTMIELILVLSIVTIMSAVIIPVGEKLIRTTEEEDALQSLIITIHSLQSYAMANNAYTQLRFIKNGSRTEYIAASRGKEEFSRKLLPEGMYVLSSSNLKVVEFHGNGNIINFGTLVLSTKKDLIRITFQFQRGRMIISESKRIFLARSNSGTHRHSHRFWYASSTRNEDDNYAFQQEISDARC